SILGPVARPTVRLVMLLDVNEPLDNLCWDAHRLHRQLKTPPGHIVESAPHVYGNHIARLLLVMRMFNACEQLLDSLACFLPFLATVLCLLEEMLRANRVYRASP